MVVVRHSHPSRPVWQVFIFVRWQLQPVLPCRQLLLPPSQERTTRNTYLRCIYPSLFLFRRQVSRSNKLFPSHSLLIRKHTTMFTHARRHVLSRSTRNCSKDKAAVVLSSTAALIGASYYYQGATTGKNCYSFQQKLCDKKHSLLWKGREKCSRRIHE